jgi:hypothetical protein
MEAPVAEFVRDRKPLPAWRAFGFHRDNRLAAAPKDVRLAAVESAISDTGAHMMRDGVEFDLVRRRDAEFAQEDFGRRHGCGLT